MDFGVFFFNSSDERIDGNYAMHAKRAVREFVGEHEPRVRNEEWHVLSGDLFGTRGAKVLLSTVAILPDGSRIAPSLHHRIDGDQALGFIPM